MIRFQDKSRKNSYGFHFFWIAGMLLLAASFFPYHYSFDVHLHDTYFVLSAGSVTMVFGAYFIFCALWYWLMRKQLNRWLLILHVIFLLFCFALIFLNAVMHFTPHSYLDVSSFRRINWLPLMFTVSFLSAQVAFTANVLLGLAKWLKALRK